MMDYIVAVAKRNQRSEVGAMSKVARICSFEDLPDWVDRKIGLSNNGSGKEYASYIIIEDGDYKVCYSDAMEPEDASFSRDLSWIVDEINRKRGREA